MKRLSTSVAATSALLVGFALGMPAAGAGGGAPAHGAQPASRPAPGVKPAAAAVSPAAPTGSPLALTVRTPDAALVRLVHLPDCGWALAPAAGGRSRLGAQPDRGAQAAQDAPDLEDAPLAVFIDGPSGNTFVWIRDHGWRFVGQVADAPG